MPHTEKDMIQAAIDDAKRAIKQHQSLKAETFKKEQEQIGRASCRERV